MTIPYPSTAPATVVPPSGAPRPRLTFLGTGYLGATYAICFAELGYEVLAMDVDTAKIAKLAEEPLGPEQEAEYAALDKEYMELAPIVPYGTNTVSTFVDSEIDLDKVIFNPTFGQDLTSFQLK